MKKLIIILLSILPLVHPQQTYTILCKDQSLTDLSTEYYECLPGDIVTYGCNRKRTPDNELLGNSIFAKVARWNTCRNLTSHLEIIANGITEITKWDIVDYPSLKTLNLSHNLIRTLGMNIFDNLNQLRVLDLSNNQINTIDPDAISWLDGLQILDISFNRLTSLDNSVFDGLHNLTELNVAGNEIADTKLVFIKLVRLERLNLSSNALKDFNFDNFRDMPNIEIFDLSYNHIKGSAKPVMFEGLNSMKYLDISHNFIFHIDSGSFTGLNLYYFDVSDNQIRGNLSADTFTGLKTTHLDLSSQNISRVRDWAYRGSKWIKYLNMSWNVINELEVDSLRELTSLELLDLTGNALTKFDVDTSDLTALQELILAWNQIMNIKYDIPSLINLDISHNKVKVLRPGIFEDLIHLEKLNLSHNGLVHMTGGAFKGLTSLTSLDLSFNNLYFVDGGLMGPLAYLEFLHLDGNHLRKFDYKVMLESKSIEHTKAVTLSMNENPLECDWLKNALIFSKTNQSLLINFVNETYTLENAEEIECFDSYKKFDYSAKQIKQDEQEKELIEMRKEIDRLIVGMSSDSAAPGSLMVGMAVTVVLLAGIIFITYRIYNKKQQATETGQSIGVFRTLN